MKKQTKVLATLAIIICGLLTGCTKAIIDESNAVVPAGTAKYTPDIQNIMFNNCTTCHGGSIPSAGLKLTTYEEVRQSIERGNLLERISDAANPMPQSGLLPPAQRTLIKQWADEGFPQN